MGARISIQFKKGKEKSPVLFSHWGGQEFKDEVVKDYMKELKKYAKKEGQTYPLSRFEPGTVMVDFIRHITKDLEVVDSDLYLGLDENDGDNSDYGHHVIEL